MRKEYEILELVQTIVITDTKKNTNSFGDLELIVTIEVRNDLNETLRTKTIKKYAVEGEHHLALSEAQKEIENYSKIIWAKFSGKVC